MTKKNDPLKALSKVISAITTTAAFDHNNELVEEVEVEVPESEVRERAYFKWEEAGCPSGDGSNFWADAENEIEEELGELSLNELEAYLEGG